MSRKANKTAVGIFVVMAIALLVAGISVFGSGLLFKKSHKFVLFFDGSVNGLTAGAPVVFRGVKIGAVEHVNLLFHPETRKIFIPVVINIELSRVKGIANKSADPDYERLIKEGLRARLDTMSFVTGQLIISFDFYPDKPARLLGIMNEYPELPTLPVSPGILDTMRELPLKDVVKDLRETSAGINRLVNSDDAYGLNNAIREITMASHTLRLFLEYIEQHPEAFLKGKSTAKGE